MPSFNIFGSSTTRQTLLSEQYGFIGQNGALVTEFSAVSVSLAFELVVLGSVTSFRSSAILGDADGAEITIGATGQVTSMEGSAINIGGFEADDLNIRNDGVLSGSTDGITVSDIGGGVNLVNTGTVVGTNSGIDANLPGPITVVNTGTITTLGVEDVFGDTFAVDLTSNLPELRNAGSIIGDVLMFSSTIGRALLVNSGLIDGTITLGNGNDEFVNAGGRINGAVSGGLGDDTYRIDSAITIQDSGGNDSIYSSVSYDIAAGIERLILTGTADIRANGNVQANVIAGNSGDNRISGQRGSDELSGGNGDDTLRGGGGNDTLVFDAGDDVLNGGGGIDTLDLSTATDAFLVNLGAGSMTGDATDNDTVTAVENVRGGSGADTLLGSGDANALSGGSGDDSLVGSGGADTLTGQSGADTLVGGNGADLFRFERFSDSPEAGPDTIADFRTAQGDLIDLSLIDANGLGSGNGTFLFSSAGFLPEGVPSVRVLQDIANNLTIVEARDSVGAAVDLRIILTGLVTLTAADFAL